MNKKRITVIGSGLGGLAVGIRLQAAGFQTTILEKRAQPGGLAHVIRDKGFTFELGPTVIPASSQVEELFHLAKRPMREYLEFFPVTPLFRLFWEDGFTFDLSTDLEKMEWKIRRKSPDDVSGYRRLEVMRQKFFDDDFEQSTQIAFLNWWNMLRLTPKLMHRSAYQSAYRLASNCINDPQLRQVFGFHSLLFGGNPLVASPFSSWPHIHEKKWGVLSPIGGIGALIRGFVKLFGDLGGEIRLNSPVEKIVTRDGKAVGVQECSGRRSACDAIVSNADVVHTYSLLLKDEPMAHFPAQKLTQKTHSHSFFLIYFGTKKKYPQIAHRNVIFIPLQHLNEMGEIVKVHALGGDFALFLNKSTFSDSSLAPEGGEAFCAYVSVPHLRDLSIDWVVEGQRYAQIIISYLNQKFMPGLHENVVTMGIFTPSGFHSEFNTHLGAAFSLESRLDQSAYFRIHNRDKRIQGLYLVGAGTHPGAGVIGTLASAKITTELISQDLLDTPSPFESNAVLIDSMARA